MLQRRQVTPSPTTPSSTPAMSDCPRTLSACIDLWRSLILSTPSSPGTGSHDRTLRHNVRPDKAMGPSPPPPRPPTRPSLTTSLTATPHLRSSTARTRTPTWTSTPPTRYSTCRSSYSVGGRTSTHAVYDTMTLSTTLWQTLMSGMSSMFRFERSVRTYSLSHTHSAHSLSQTLAPSD